MKHLESKLNQYEQRKSTNFYCAVVNVWRQHHSKISGDDGEGEPPVPIPNTAVKPFSADSTWLVTTWEGRTSPDFSFLLSSVGRARDC